MLSSLKSLNRTDSLISLIEADLKHGKPDVCATSSQVDNDAPSLLSSQSDDIGLGKDDYMQPRGHWSLCESCHNIIMSSKWLKRGNVFGLDHKLFDDGDLSRVIVERLQDQSYIKCRRLTKSAIKGTFCRVCRNNLEAIAQKQGRVLVKCQKPREVVEKLSLVVYITGKT